MKNMVLKLGLFLVACSLVMGTFYIVFQRMSPRIVEIKPKELCDLQAQDCLVQIAEQKSLRFSLNPRPIPARDPIALKVSLINIAPKSVAVDFVGMDQETPFRRPFLSESSKGIWVGETDLTHCKEEKMNWAVTVLIELDRETWAVPFRIVTLQDYNKSAQLGVSLAPVPKGGDFEIETADGKWESSVWRGSFYFLYFGYTFCPDICPTTLSTLGSAIKKLSPAESKIVRAVFVSLDPARDNPEHLRSYASFFLPNLVGGTSHQENLLKITRQFGASFKINSPKPGAKHYSVDHSGDLYLIDPDGKWVETLPHGVSQDRILEALRGRMKNRLSGKP